jgi:hypothetical protein
MRKQEQENDSGASGAAPPVSLPVPMKKFNNCQ